MWYGMVKRFKGAFLDDLAIVDWEVVKCCGSPTNVGPFCTWLDRVESLTGRTPRNQAQHDQMMLASTTIGY
jgi:hypothetical protein